MVVGFKIRGKGIFHCFSYLKFLSTKIPYVVGHLRVEKGKIRAEMVDDSLCAKTKGRFPQLREGNLQMCFHFWVFDVAFFALKSQEIDQLTKRSVHYKFEQGSEYVKSQ